MKILQFKEIGTNYSRILSVTLRLTKKCNFSCNYCMEYDNNFENISYELLKDFLINFIKLIKETSHYDKIFWYIHGGEPTMYPNFFNLLIDLDAYQNKYNLDYKIEIQTNGSYKKLKKFKEIQNRNISFLCSYQNHQNNLTDFKLFIENLLNLNLLSGVDIMLENFNTPHEFINIKNLSDWLKLKRLKLSKDFSIQYNTIDGISTKKLPIEYKIFNNNFNENYEITFEENKIKIFNRLEVIDNQFNKFKMFKCEVGKNNLIFDIFKNYIDIYKCFSENVYNRNKPSYKLNLESNIENFNIDLLNLLKPTICNFNKCLCELHIPKKRIKK